MAYVDNVYVQLKKILQLAVAYLQERCMLWILKSSHAIANLVSFILLFFVGIIFFFLVITLLAFGCAGLINAKLHSTYAGFFIMATVLLLSFVPIFFLVKSVMKNVIIKAILNLTSEEQKHEDETPTATIE